VHDAASVAGKVRVEGFLCVLDSYASQRCRPSNDFRAYYGGNASRLQHGVRKGSLYSPVTRDRTATEPGRRMSTARANVTSRITQTLFTYVA
jgi:hypothetical protein